MLNICLLGKTNLEYKGRNISDQLGTKAVALICLLVTNQNKYLSREKIITYLWPDSNEDAAKYNLRYNLWQIKKCIHINLEGEQFLHVDKDCCGLNSKYKFKCDILEITNFKQSPEDTVFSVSKLHDLFKGEFLEGCYFNNCDEFNELILFQRINIENKKVKILKRLSCLYEEEKNYDACREIINEIHEIEPYNEEMALKIMKLYILQGDRVGALNYYNSFSSKLSSNLGISPNQELRAFYKEIRNQYKEPITTLSSKMVNKQNCRHKNRKKISINTYCIAGIEYFWVAQVIEKLINEVPEEYFVDFENRYLLDLGGIQREALLYVEEKTGETIKQIEATRVSDICIINAFTKFLEHIIRKQSIEIFIDNSKELDGISANVVKHLEKSKLSNLTILS